MITILISLILFPLLAGCGGNPQETEAKTTLYLATGGSGSSYASLGQEVAEWINAHSENIYVVPQLSAGPEANLRILSTDGPQLGIITADLAYYAREGTEFFKNEEAVDFRLLALLDTEPLYFLCGEASGIKDAGSLKGKKISLGSGDSRTHILADPLLQGIGFALNSAAVSYLAPEEALLLLEEKRLDAAFVMGPLTGSAAAKAGKNKILSYTKEQDEMIRKALPFLMALWVPKGSFAGQEDQVPVPAIPVYLAVSGDLPRELLEELAAALKGSRFQWIDAEETTLSGIGE